MATATLERTTETTQNGAKQTAKTAMPVLDWEINPIASKNGLQPDFVANSIANSGGTVAKVGNVFVTSREAWTGFVDGYLNQIRDGLLGTTVSQPAATKTKPTITGKKKGAGKTQSRAKAPTRKPTQGKPKAQAQPSKSVRSIVFKNFKLSNSYSRTLGAFLDAQKWDAAKRIEVIEALAALPTEPGNESDFAEQCVKKITSVYPAAKRKGNFVRQGLIDAAKGMTGGQTAA